MAFMILNPVTFPDEINLLFSSKSMKYLFEIIYIEDFKVSDWLKANKICINIDKTKSITFHNFRTKKNMMLRLPLLPTDGLKTK